MELDWPNYTSSEQNPEIIGVVANQSGEYTLTGKTEFGCEASSMLNVVVNVKPTVEINAPNSLCENDALQLTESGGTNINNWEWSNDKGATFSGQTWDLGAAQVDFSANYILKVTDSNGCIGDAEKMITINKAPNAGEDISLAYCQGESIDLSNQLVGNDPNGIFESSLNATQFDGTFLNTLNITEGNYAIVYKVERDGCPKDEATLSIKIDEQKMAGLDNMEMACQGTTIDLTGLLQQASEGGIFQETSNSGGLNGNDFSTSQLSPSNYIIDYVVGSGNTCGEDRASFTIEVAEQVSAGTDVASDICPSGIIDISMLLENATSGGIYTDLSPSNALAGSMLTADNLALGEYLFDYLVQSNNQCPSDTARISITVKDLLSAGMDNDSVFCIGAPISLSSLLVDADAGGEFSPLGGVLPDFTGTILSTEGLNAARSILNIKLAEQ